MAERPNREPDVSLPEEYDISQVHIWIAEGIFAIHSLNNCHHSIISSSQTFYTPRDYLEFTANRTDLPIRSSIAAIYILELAFSSNRNDITT